MRIPTPAVPLCDFCSDRPVAWDYPCRDFSLRDAAGGFNSSEGWAACENCHTLIQRGDREGLARRSRDRFTAHHPGERPLRLHLIRRLHDAFWANREGPPRVTR